MYSCKPRKGETMKTENLQNLPFEIQRKKRYELHKVSKMGNITEVQYISRRNSKCNSIKLDKDSYLNLKDGCIYDYKHTTNRSEGKNSLRKTFYKMRGLINANITDVSCVRWITLTYAENMTDTKQLYTDFRDFHKRFKRYCKVSGWAEPEYIVMMEPQQRGAWHAHLLYIWDTAAPFIPNDQLARIWGHGFVMVKKLDNVDNVGAYLTAYMTDLVISEDDLQKGEVKKAVLKGARLKLYPTGMQIVRHSRGIKQPDVELKSESDALEEVKGMSETYRKTKHITTEDGFSMYIETVYYNSIRRGSAAPAAAPNLQTGGAGACPPRQGIFCHYYK